MDDMNVMDVDTPFENAASGEMPSINGAAVVDDEMQGLTLCLSGSVCSFSTGRTGDLTTKEMQLLRLIFEHYKQGIQVKTRTVRKIAEDIVPGFRSKSLSARSQVVW